MAASDAKSSGIEGNRLIRRGIADRAAHGPDFSGGGLRNHIDVDGSSRQQGGDGVRNRVRPGGDFVCLQQANRYGSDVENQIGALSCHGARRGKSGYS